MCYTLILLYIGGFYVQDSYVSSIITLERYNTPYTLDINTSMKNTFKVLLLRSTLICLSCLLRFHVLK